MNKHAFMLLISFIKTKAMNALRSGGRRAWPQGCRSVLSDLERDGVVVIKNFVAVEAARSLALELLTVMNEKPDLVMNRQDSRLFGVERFSDPIGNVMNDPVLQQISDTIHGCNTTLAFVLGNVVSERGPEGSGGGWHRDSIARQFKCMLYLSDVCEKSGPFEYLLGSHKLAEKMKAVVKASASWNQLRFCNDEVTHLKDVLKLESRLMTGGPGDLVLFDSTGLHRGKPIEKPSRIALTSYYYPRHSVNNQLLKKFNLLKVD